MSVGVVNAPLKVIVPVVLLSTTLVPVVTAPLKVVPPELVRVNIPISVPILPDTLTIPAVLIVRLDALAESVPTIELKFTVLAMPVPTVNVTPSAKVAAPKVT